MDIQQIMVDSDQEMDDNDQEIDDSDQEMDIRVQQSKLLHLVYDTLCGIEYDIINKKIELDGFHEVIKNSTKLINELLEMPNCIIIKVMQISQLLLQINNPIFDDCIQEFQQFVKQYEDDYEQLNLIWGTKTYEISKAYIFDNAKGFKYIALSPNEKYLLVGTSRQVYLYDILTNLNIKTFKRLSNVGFFSSNSKKIILVNYVGIIMIDINTSKQKQYRIKGDISMLSCSINQNYLYTTITNYSQHYSRIIKIDLKTNHQIFSYKLSEDCYSINTQFVGDLLALQQSLTLEVLNEQTRKSELKIKLSDYKISTLYLIHKNQIISGDFETNLIIWNIDYLNNSLIKNKLLPFAADELLRSNPSFGYFYIISFDGYKIIDENYNCIYTDNQQYTKKYHSGSIQFNTQRIFILFQNDGIYILKRHKEEKIQ